MDEKKTTYYCIKKKILGRRPEGKRVIAISRSVEKAND